MITAIPLCTVIKKNYQAYVKTVSVTLASRNMTNLHLDNSCIKIMIIVIKTDSWQQYPNVPIVHDVKNYTIFLAENCGFWFLYKLLPFLGEGVALRSWGAMKSAVWGVFPSEPGCLVLTLYSSWQKWIINNYSLRWRMVWTKTVDKVLRAHSYIGFSSSEYPLLFTSEQWASDLQSECNCCWNKWVKIIFLYYIISQS